MQLIWVSGPTARVVTLSITLPKVMAALGMLSTFFIVVGFAFHFIGLRMAVEYSPEIVHSIGGVTSKSELERIEAGYRDRLSQLQHQVEGMMDTVRGIEQHKQRMAELIGWDAGRQLINATADKGRLGQGGPSSMLSFLSPRPIPLATQFNTTSEELSALGHSLESLQQRWDHELDKMHRLPTSLPLEQPFAVTSGFGIRLDPFTRMPDMHQGIDFVADVGTPVRATAPGIVVQSERAGAYGNLVEVEHADGYSTRYAHLQSRRVKVGQTLQRGEVLGTLGNTGRSTGPHLHYEILRHGRAQHPERAFLTKDRS